MTIVDSIAPSPVDIVVVGAGAFGLTTALELARRGRRVAVVDPGPIPHPLAASTDASKAVRMDYGADAKSYVDAFFANVQWDEVNRRAEGVKARTS